MTKSAKSSRASARVLTRFGGIFDLDTKTRQLEDLNRQASNNEFWSDTTRAQGMLRQKAELERVIEHWAALRNAADDVGAMVELGEESGGEDGEAMLQEANNSLESLAKKLHALEVERLFSDEHDPDNAIVEINSGAGGTDASDWAAMLMRMYVRWAERQGFKVSILDEQPHPEAGIKSVTLEISGPYAFGYVRSEIGVHRLVRISPFDAAARRHTAFAAVAAWPDIDDSIQVDIKESDLKIDTYRSSGAGGQSVNTTDSAVRLTHLPTGLVVACQNERSQHKNKAMALKLLRAKIYQHEEEKRQAAIDAVNADKKKIEWGSQIRSYVLQPYRLVKDNRTGASVSNTDRVLDGDILVFMEAWLAQKAGLAEAGPLEPDLDI